MNRSLSTFFGGVAAIIFLSGCATSNPQSHDSNMQAYLNRLKSLESQPSAAPGSPAAKAGIERFTKFFENMTEESVRTLTSETYAKDAFFNDTLKTIHGAADIEKYFLETVHNTESVKATIEDVAVSGDNYYVRWNMEVRLKKFKRGQSLNSIGITHLRFNPEGQIVMHQDFWDSSAGFFEHVPVVGGLIRAIKSRL